ncbi:MAG: hypothetical protein AB7P50_08970 [Alphaproteobacteria bacterium]
MHFPHPIRFLAEKLYMRLIARRAGRIRSQLYQTTPSLEAGWQAIIAHGGRKDDFQVCRVAELVDLLDRVQPRRITELGSGLSTVVFASFAQRTGAVHTSYEENASWAEVTKSGLIAANLPTDCVQVVPAGIKPGGVGYGKPIPDETDFVYIDGPSIKIEGRKVPNVDVAEFCRSGGRPRFIVIDGRVQTVDFLHAALPKFRVRFSSQYALKTGRLRYFFPFHIHSVLIEPDQPRTGRA